MNAEVIADKICAALPEVKMGALRMWGEWFGSPYDNCHKIAGCSAIGSVLVLKFNEGGTLRVDNPEGLEVSKPSFSIRGASAVRWEWFYYGKPHAADNLYYYQLNRNEPDPKLRGSILSRVMYFAFPLLPNPIVVIQSSYINIAPQQLAKQLQIRLDQFRNLRLEDRRQA